MFSSGWPARDTRLSLEGKRQKTNEIACREVAEPLLPPIALSFNSVPDSWLSSVVAEEVFERSAQLFSIGDCFEFADVF